MLGVTGGSASIQLGGPYGWTLDVDAGDVLVLPASVAHKNLGADRDFQVVGAYPDGQDWDLKRGEPGGRLVVDRSIEQVPIPECDPLYGAEGPLLAHWSEGETHLGCPHFLPNRLRTTVSLFLTKVLSLFIHPLSLGLLLLLVGGIVSYWWYRIGLVGIAVGVLVIWIPATPVFSDWLQGTLESRYPPDSVSAAPVADAIVVLGGSVGAPRPPRVYPDLSGASDRVWHAARLYEANKAPLVIAAGGTLPWKDQTFREAPVMQDLLASWGVPPDSVLLESSSANTYENARFTADLVSARGMDRVLLVTSALHMRRALATFRSAGVNAEPIATDYQVVEGTTTLLSVIPKASALAESTAAIREYVGYVVYDWRGWIAAQQLRENRSWNDRRLACS